MMPKKLFIVALLLASCSPIRGCVESQFTLAPESRLPKWFSLPQGVSRNDVTVTLKYYAPPVPVDDAELDFMKKDGQKLSEATGQRCWHPEMKKKRNQYGGFDPDSYPHYVYIRVNGTVEVIEHTRGPTFKIIDDPKLVEEAVGSNRCEKN
jgi:hypothetical protein